MKRTALSILALSAALPAFAQDLPFTIQIVEDPRTKKAIETAPGVAPADLELRYAAEKPAPRLSVQAWQTGGGTEFRAWSNYALFVDRAEIVVRQGGAEIAAVPIRLGGMARVARTFPADATYALRARSGRRTDETVEKHFAKAGQGAPAPGELLYHAQDNDLKRQRIPIRGRAITADGAGVAPGQVVDYEGYRIPVDADGRFEMTQIVPAGERVLDLSVMNRDGRILTRYSQPVAVADEDFFYVGIADLTIGRNNVNGPIEEVTGDDSGRFDEEIYVDGRLAFYLRGKVKGEWLLTASADTREGPIEDLFDNFLDSDAQSFLRRLDPEEYYPVYGDDSTAIMDAPTDGKLYVRLERDGTELLWGNFKTRAPDNHFTNFTRSLYGARVRVESDPETRDRGWRAEVFAAEPGTVQAQDEFRGTGGSLYYLRNQDILTGSPRVWIETRDQTTGVLIERRELVAYEDYEVNAIQGRITLTDPLGSSGAGGSLIGGITTGGNPQYLVVTYEYTPGVGDPGETVFGGSAEADVTERLTLGVNAIRQQDGPNEQTLAGVTARYRLTENSRLELELARSEDGGALVHQSIDGGFTFTQKPGGAAGQDAGAGRIAMSLDLGELGLGDGRADLFWQRREAGFSGPGEQTDEAVTQYGADIAYALSPTTELRFLAEGRDSDSQTSEVYEIDIAQKLNAATTLSYGLRYDDLTTRTVNASNDLSSTGRRVDAILRVDYEGGPNWRTYGYVQGTLEKTGTRGDNNRVGIGGSYDVNDRLSFGGELSTGTGGLGAVVTGSWQVDDRTRTWLSYSLEPDSIDNTYRGQIGQFTYGGSRQINDYVHVLAEQTYHHGDGPVGVVNSVGIDLTPDSAWSFGLRAEAGDIADPISGDLDRKAVSLSAAYSEADLRFANTLEYRIDKGTATRESWGLKSRLSYQVDDDWRFLARLGAATSDSTDPAVEDTRYVEFTTGFAYRPVEHDRLNALFRYTYLYDTASPGQVGAGGVADDMVQRSHVLSADAIYEFNNTLSLGGKVGWRLGDVKFAGGDWVSSDAYLGVIRADIRLRPKWDILAEYRYLDTPDANATRDGALLAVYRRVNKNFRVGLGYNATDFSDDLTDQSYSSDGLFLNVIGKF